MSHGRNDTLLPFAVAEILRDRLAAAGAKVDWLPFVGGHEIPPTVLDAVGTFLRARSATRTALSRGCRASDRPGSTH